MTTNSIEAIAFDKDGVIFDSEMIYRWSLQEALRIHDVQLDSAIIDQFVGLTAHKTFELLSLAVGEQIDPQRLAQTWLAQRDKRLAQSGLPFVTGAENVIETLYNQGYPLALVTSDTQENVLIDFQATRAELLSCFSVIVTIDDVNYPKPDPEPYERAAILLGVAPEHLLVIEDSDYGARAACEAGAQTLLLCEQRQPDASVAAMVAKVVSSHAEVLDYLR